MTGSDTSARPAERPHFVWMSTALGPKAQKWGALDYGERDRLKPYVLASYPLTDEETSLSVDELSQRYPLRAHRP